MRELVLGGWRNEDKRINLRDLGFVGRVSAEARAEIEAAERRAARVIQTAHQFWFDGRLRP